MKAELAQALGPRWGSDPVPGAGRVSGPGQVPPRPLHHRCCCRASCPGHYTTAAADKLPRRLCHCRAGCPGHFTSAAAMGQAAQAVMPPLAPSDKLPDHYTATATARQASQSPAPAEEAVQTAGCHPRSLLRAASPSHGATAAAVASIPLHMPSGKLPRPSSDGCRGWASCLGPHTAAQGSVRSPAAGARVSG